MTNIAIEDLTTIKVDGTGAFDSLMQATKNHLQEEYKAGRIKGAEYSQVYLGSLVAVMDQAVKFLTIQQQDKLIAAQIQEIEARKTLTEAQRDNAIIEGQNLVLQGQLLEKQLLLNDAQIGLMNQKVKTEKAQIKDVVDGAPVQGVIGKQKTLYERQADGFLRDAEHKMAKLMADVWAVQRTTDEGFAPSTQLANASIDSVITKAKQGVGV